MMCCPSTPPASRFSFRLALLASAFAFAAVPVQAQDTELRPLPFRIVGESFVALQVPDISAAASWYTDAFALLEAHQIEAPDGRYFIRLLNGSGLTVELIQARAAQPVPDRHHGFFKVGIFVDDIEAAFEWFKKRSPSTDQRIFIDQKLRARSFLLRDPFGNRIQFFSRCSDDCESTEAP